MSKIKKIGISLFIMLNLMAMVRVHLPQNCKAFKATYALIDPYLSFFSIYQDWLMFAPVPSRINAFLTAEVEFQDGSRDVYEFPRPRYMSIVEKYLFGERYRKIITEAIRRDDHSWMWKDTAKFGLRQMRQKHFQKIPLRVRLVRHWEEIPPLQQTFRPHGTKASSYQSFNFYTYEVL